MHGWWEFSVVLSYFIRSANKLLHGRCNKNTVNTVSYFYVDDLMLDGWNTMYQWLKSFQFQTNSNLFSNKPLHANKLMHGWCNNSTLKTVFRLNILLCGWLNARMMKHNVAMIKSSQLWISTILVSNKPLHVRCNSSTLNTVSGLKRLLCRWLNARIMKHNESMMSKSSQFQTNSILVSNKPLHGRCSNSTLNTVSGLNRLLCRRYNARTLTPHLRA